MLEAFVANYKRLKTPASISSACHSFGNPTSLLATSSSLQNDSSGTHQQIVPVRQQIVPVRAFECRVCRKLFSNEEGLKEHTLLHVGESLIICEVCGEKFIFQSGLRQHMVSKHGIERCYLCDLVLGSKKDLLVHMQSHFGERAKSFLCHECGNFYCDAAELQNHMMTHNARRRNFACDVCKKRFQTKGRLTAHVTNFHKSKNEIAELWCSVCNKKFLLKSNLLRHVGHVRTHQEGHSLKMRK